MASLRDIIGGLNFSIYGADTDDLIRSAQTGNLNAYKELMRRGEMIPPPAQTPGRFGRHGGPATRGFPGLERPAYLDRGISRDMSRPAYRASGPNMDDPNAERHALRTRGDEPPMAQPQGLPFMSAINPTQPEAPSYLGQNLMTSPAASRGSQTISALAGGNDAAGVIQSGASAADDVAGVAGPTDVLPPAVKSLTEAFMSEDTETEDPYEGMVAQTIQDLLKGVNPEQNRNMALAQAGFAMAGSGSPYFFQGIGIGGQAGIKAYNEAQERDMEARVRAGRLGTDLSQTREQKRAHRAGEKLEAGRLQETARSNVTQEGLEAARNAEQIRANKAGESINRAQLGISAQNAATAAGNLQIARDNYAFTQRQYEEGKAGDDALQKAQTDLVKAQTEAATALNLDRNTDIETAEDGTLVMLDLRTNQATPFIGSDGKPVKAQPKSTSSKAFVAQYLARAGRSQDYIADVLAGKKQITEKDAIQTAADAATKESATILDVTQQNQVYKEVYDRVYSSLMGYAQQQAPAPAPQQSGAPAPQGAPIQPKSQSDIDNAPSGTRFIINGKEFVKP